MKTKNNAQKHKKHSKAAIVFTGVVISMVFICMCTYMVWYSKSHEIEMFDNSYNSYQNILAKEITRGSIYSSDNELLAYTEVDNKKESRIYPYANMFSHVIGYSTNGRMGVEAEYNYYLSNSHSGIMDRIDAGANEQKVPGDDIYTTLNTDLQEVAYNSLGAYKGAIIVTEVKTGRILALVSKPDFDPNTIEQTWNKMISDKENSVLLNRVTQGLYPPGSTFKIITSLEYIRENPDAYNSYHFNCSGHFNYEDNYIQCYHGSVHGSIDFATSFAKSCNSSFANIGISLDKGDFEETLNDLMFGQKLPVDFPTKMSGTGINKDADIHNLMQGSIGQGQDVITPLHLNMITCAIANRGVLMKPHMVDFVRTNDGALVKKINSQKISNLLKEEECEILTELMTGVVEYGTATRLKNAGYTAAGKTGSAEYNSNKGDSHAWFTGFAPVEDPEIALTIIIEGAGSGGEYSVPVAKRIFDEYFN